MKFLIRALGVLLALLVLGLGAAVFTIDSLAARGIEAGATRALGVATDVGSVHIGLLRGTFGMNDLAIENPPGFRGDYIFKFRRTGFAVDTSSLRQPTIKVPLFTVDGVAVVFERAGRTTNVDAILANLKRFEAEQKRGSEPAAPEGSGEPTLVIDQLVIRDVKAWVDVVDPTGLVRMDGVEVEIPEIRIQNVGGRSGASYAELTNTIVKAVLVNVAKHGGKLPVEVLGQLTSGLKPLASVSTSVTGMATDAAGKAADTVIRGGAEKLVEGVGNLFGGKKSP